MRCTLQSENRRLKAERKQLDEQIEKLLEIVKSQSIELAVQQDLIHSAQQWIRELEER